MKKSIFYFLWLMLVFPVWVSAQKKDTARKYLSQNLELTTRNKMAFAAVSIRERDHWLLYAVYPDTGKLLTMYFNDEGLTVRDGPFSLYYPGGQKAVEGTYSENVPNGIWRYWHKNGNLKDSGLLVFNHMGGTWNSFDEQGRLVTISNYRNADSIRASTNFYKRKTTVKNSAVVADEAPVAILDGLFKRYHPNGKTADSGYFHLSFRNGSWNTWYPSGGRESAGFYNNDSMSGQWQFYREDGTLATKETYRNNKVSSLECYDEQGNFSGIACSILKPPVPLGNFYVFNDYMMDNVFWPKELINKNVQGNVKVLCTISKDGKLAEMKVTESPHELFSKEVERFFKTIERWSPAISHNRPVEFTQEFTVPFLKMPY